MRISSLSWIHGFVTCLLFDFSFSLNRLGRRGTPQGRAGRGRVGRYPPPSRVVSPGLKCFMNTLFSLLSLFRKDPPPKWRFSWAIAKMRDLDQNWVQLSRTPQIRSTPPPPLSPDWERETETYASLGAGRLTTELWAGGFSGNKETQFTSKGWYHLTKEYSFVIRSDHLLHAIQITCGIWRKDCTKVKGTRRQSGDGSLCLFSFSLSAMQGRRENS